MNQQDATSEYVSMAMDAVQIYTFVNSEAQARVRQGSAKGWSLRRKASKLKLEPRAYTKVGCHHPPTRKSH